MTEVYHPVDWSKNMSDVLFTRVHELLNRAASARVGNVFKDVGGGVTYDLPTLAGWAFVAIVEPVTLESGLGQCNLVQRAPGQFCPEGLQIRCDHCRLTKHRKQIFVLKGDKFYRCVGRPCLREFAGLDPSDFVKRCEIVAELGSLLEAAAHDDWTFGVWYADFKWNYDLIEFVAWTASVVRHKGWNPKNKRSRGHAGREKPTAGLVLYYLTPLKGVYDRYPELRRQYEAERRQLVPTQGDYEEAVHAVAWAKSIPESACAASTYFCNLNNVARAGYADRQTSGLCASILEACRKARKIRA